MLQPAAPTANLQRELLLRLQDANAPDRPFGKGRPRTSGFTHTTLTIFGFLASAAPLGAAVSLDLSCQSGNFMDV
jgi:hypothetical protein